MSKISEGLKLIITGKINPFKTVMFYLRCKSHGSDIKFMSVIIGRRVKLTYGKNFKANGKGQLFIGHDIGKFPRSSRSAFRIGNNACLILNQKYLLLSGCQVNIDDNSILELGSGYMNHDGKIICRKHISIGNNVIVGENTIIMDSDAHTIDGGEISKAITIGNNVWIGIGCTILKGVEIAEGSVIAAGSLVTKSVDADTLVGGVPAKVLKQNIKWKN